MRPSSFEIGWSPPARSMIERRRIARPQGPSITDPSESGPRWISVSFIAASAVGSGAVAPSRLTRPHIPHMRGRLGRSTAELVLLLALLGLGVALPPGLRLLRHVGREVAERDIGVDQMEAPG